MFDIFGLKEICIIVTLKKINPVTRVIPFTKLLCTFQHHSKINAHLQVNIWK